MVTKDQWQMNYDKQRGEIKSELSELLGEYPEPVVREAVLEFGFDLSKDDPRSEYEEMWRAEENE